MSDLARDCVLMSRARALSEWVGSGKPVTAKGVLRRADVDPATAAIGAAAPRWVRTAADLEALHRPWVAAEAAGLLALDLHRATARTPHGHDPTCQWLAGVRAVLRVESNDDQKIGASVVCRAVLRTLSARPTSDADQLEEIIEEELRSIDSFEAFAAHQAFRRGVMPEDAGLELLIECGGVDAVTMTVTPLGAWAQDRLSARAVPASTSVGVHPDQIFQLKIGLRGFGPQVWRRVQLPSTTDLGVLHRIIQIVLAWDDDHLHVFTTDGMPYADPYHGLDGCTDEGTITLGAVLPRPGASVGYRYDLGDCWDHTITLEKVLDQDDGTYPRCVAGRGDAPAEDWGPDSPQESIPFVRDTVNRQLAGLSPGASAPARR